MNKIYLFGGGALVLALVAGGLLMMSNGPSPKSAVLVDTKTETKSVSTTLKQSLKDFLSSSETKKCTFSSEDANSLTEGMTFIANGKVRNDSKTTIKKTNTTMTNSSIVDGGVMYAWGSEMPSGIKMDLSTMEAMKTKAGASTAPKNTPTQAADFETAHDYNCNSWSVDQAVFVPPTHITFTDYGEMMKKIMDMNGIGSDGEVFDPKTGTMESRSAAKVGNVQMCLACNQAPSSEAKAQCKIALSCK